MKRFRCDCGWAGSHAGLHKDSVLLCPLCPLCGGHAIFVGMEANIKIRNYLGHTITKEIVPKKVYATYSTKGDLVSIKLLDMVDADVSEMLDIPMPTPVPWLLHTNDVEQLKSFIGIDPRECDHKETEYVADFDRFFCCACRLSMGQEYYDANIGAVRHAERMTERMLDSTDLFAEEANDRR